MPEEQVRADNAIRHNTHKIAFSVTPSLRSNSKSTNEDITIQVRIATMIEITGDVRF